MVHVTYDDVLFRHVYRWRILGRLGTLERLTSTLPPSAAKFARKCSRTRYCWIVLPCKKQSEEEERERESLRGVAVAVCVLDALT